MHLDPGHSRLGDKYALVLKPRVGRNHRKTIRFELQKIVAQQTVHRIAVAEAHPNPKPFHLGAGGEQAQLFARLALLEISNKTNQFHVADKGRC